MERLTPSDASFLAQERSGAHMHIGGILLFDGGAPAHDELAAHVESRLHLVPRYRQKLAFPRFEMGRPLWVDDPRFNIGYHVRTTALPRPGSLDQLRALAGRVFSQRLDRSKPLWEMWLVHGVDGGRCALVSKVHHSVVDGLAGVDLTTVLLDAGEAGADVVPEPREWNPGPEPTQAQLVAEAVKGILHRPERVASAALQAVRSPGRSLARAAEAGEALGQVAWSAINRAPETPLNVPTGPHRRVHWVGASLEDLKRPKDDFGGSLNDVYIACVAGALRRWLRRRHVRTEGLDLRAGVPVSVRPPDGAPLGSHVRMTIAPLPVYAERPVERLSIVAQATRGLRDSKQALGAQVLTNLQDFAPPTIFAQASRVAFSSRAHNLLVTNVPGPQFALRLLGRRLREIVPVPFLSPGHALAIAMMSYDGRVSIGLMSDPDAIGELEELGADLEHAIAEMAAVSGG
ncbi:MAG TPA: wax ester/triacylglycerol synthase family O-acyltransferase [Thermoleophilaceae bacterium]|nr:wax ester/triacylglycerol synthase family O-acyltransferase [Thermoleophilaceae bacterium]